MLAEKDLKSKDKSIIVQNEFIANAGKVIVPVMLTLLTGTFTYPLASKLVRSWPLRLRGFYAIHLAIAPLLAYIHVHIFGISHAYCRIKITEAEFERNSDKLKHLQPEKIYKHYYELKSLLLQVTDAKKTKMVKMPRCQKKMTKPEND